MLTNKVHTVPCHRELETYLAAYMEALGDRLRPSTALFQSIAHTWTEGTVIRVPTGNPMNQKQVYAMVRRRAKRVGIETNICNHTFRATAITEFLEAGGALERAAIIAVHASTRTTQLYDRRSKKIAWSEIEQMSYGKAPRE